MPSLKHVHTYELRQSKAFGDKRKKLILIRGERSYRCIDPNCTHYTEYSALVGKNAICPECRETFILTKNALTLVLPRCLDCRNTRESRNNQEVRSLVDSVITEIAANSVAAMEEKQKKALELQKEHQNA